MLGLDDEAFHIDELKRMLAEAEQLIAKGQANRDELFRLIDETKARVEKPQSSGE